MKEAMMAYVLSLLPRRWLQHALYAQWARTLPRGEALRLEHFGGTGNADHHAFAWADDLRAALARRKGGVL